MAEENVAEIPTEIPAETSGVPHLRAYFCGSVDYLTALQWQETLRNRILGGDGSDTVLFLEHPAVVTAGRHANPAELAPEGRAADGTTWIQTQRGGLWTWHGPGQLVVYPVITLRRYRLSGPKTYVSSLCGAVRDALAELGLASVYHEGEPGVWTVGETPRKLASVGVHLHKGVAIHGLALNVAPDLGAFQRIRPCGMASDVMTSVQRELGQAPTVRDMAFLVGQALGQTLGATVFLGDFNRGLDWALGNGG